MSTPATALAPTSNTSTANQTQDQTVTLWNHISIARLLYERNYNEVQSQFLSTIRVLNDKDSKTSNPLSADDQDLRKVATMGEQISTEMKKSGDDKAIADEQITAHIKTGYEKMIQRKLMEALEAYNSVLKIHPNFSPAKLCIVLIIEKLNNVAECDTALKILPGDYRILQRKGNLFLIQNDYQKALECYREVIRINPQAEGVLARIFEVLVALNRDDSIKPIFDNEIIFAYCEFGVQLVKNIEFAVQFSKRIYTKEEATAGYLINMLKGRIHLKRKEWILAVPHFINAEMFQQCSVAYFIYFYQSNDSQRYKRDALAKITEIKEIEELWNHFPMDADVLERKAQCLEKENNFKDAEWTYGAAIRYLRTYHGSEDRVRLLKQKAKSLEKMGNFLESFNTLVEKQKHDFNRNYEPEEFNATMEQLKSVAEYEQALTILNASKLDEPTMDSIRMFILLAKARFLGKQGRINEGLKICDELLKGAVKYDTTYICKIDILIMPKQYLKAYECWLEFKKTLGNALRGMNTIDKYNLKVTSLIDSIEVFDAALKLSPTDINLYIFKAKHCIKLGQNEPAREVYKAGVVAGSKDYNFIMSYAKYLDKMGEHAEALKMLDTLIFRHEESKPIAYVSYRAQILRKLGKESTAQASCINHLHAHELRRSAGYYYKIKTLVMVGDYATALKEVLASSQDRARLTDTILDGMELGRTSLELRRSNRHIHKEPKLQTELLEVDGLLTQAHASGNSTNLELFQRKAMLLLKLNRNAEALGMFMIVVMMDTTHADAKWGEKEAARRLLAERALEYDKTRDQNLKDVHKDNIMLMLSLDRFEDALASSEGILKVKRDDPELLLAKGNCYFHLANYTEALKCVEASLKISPSNTAYILLGELKLKSNEPKAAIENFELVLRDDYTDYRAHLGKGKALLLLGNNEAALKHLTETIHIEPQLLEAYLKKAKALKNLGRFNKALEAIEVIRKANPFYIEAQEIYTELLKLNDPKAKKDTKSTADIKEATELSSATKNPSSATDAALPNSSITSVTATTIVTGTQSTSGGSPTLTFDFKGVAGTSKEVEDGTKNTANKVSGTKP